MTYREDARVRTLATTKTTSPPKQLTIKNKGNSHFCRLLLSPSPPLGCCSNVLDTRSSYRVWGTACKWQIAYRPASIYFANVLEAFLNLAINLKNLRPPLMVRSEVTRGSHINTPAYNTPKGHLGNVLDRSIPYLRFSDMSALSGRRHLGG